MAPESEWSRVLVLFEEASALTPGERTGFLTQLEEREPALRPRVEELLAAESRDDDDFLESPLGEGDVQSLVGKRIGGFRVVRPVASGGMGSVWEAEQDEPRRKVALKTMRTGIASAHSRRRFRFESELLAGLRHPAIAQVYDAGVLAAADAPSLPWFALEFVEGARPLFQYTREEGLDLAARLRLFLDVCRAVQHAHQRGVIHCDLKAANLLVDGEGHVKVIDFGIARVIDRAKLGDGRAQTREGDVIGTLETMSPEQVGGKRSEIDARSDVYSLGAALYELATDRSPYDLAGLPLPDAARHIREVEPVPPSRIADHLPREIDWIVATAMSKEPERRYQAASELEHDLERLLARQPVLAGPPSKTYRMRKFYERHRTSVAASVVGLVAVIVGSIGAVFGFVETQRARSAEATAALETDLAGRFSQLLGELFEGAKPEETDGQPLSRRELLDRGTQWIETKLEDRPFVRSRLLATVGGVYTSLGDYEEARDLLEKSVELARESADEHGPSGERQLFKSLVRLGRLYRHTDRTASAEKTLREALALGERIHPDDHEALGPLLNQLGVLLKVEDPEESLAFLGRAHAALVATRGGEDGDTGVLLANMGTVELRLRHHEQARELFERALPLVVAGHGERDPRTGGLYSNLALIHLNLANYERALEMQLADLDILAESALGDHPYVGLGNLNLAQIHGALGDVDAARSYAESALEVFLGRLGPAHANTLHAKTFLGQVLVRAGDYGEARSVLESAVEQKVDGAGARLAQQGSLVEFAALLRLEGRLDEALAIIERVLADPIALSDPVVVSNAHWGRAYVLATQGGVEEADEARALALGIQDEPPRFGVEQPLASAKFAAVRGDPSAAIAILARAIEGGYTNATALTDPDLEAARLLPAFEPIRDSLDR